MFPYPSSAITSKLATVLVGEAVAIALRDSVAVAAAVLAVVGAVLLVPNHSVHGAVGSLGGAVLAKDVGVEEVAGIVSAVRPGVFLVVGRSRQTSSGALAGVEGTRVVFSSHVIAGGVDGATKRGGS